MNPFYLIALLSLASFSQQIFAYSDYYNESPTGWHWNNVDDKTITPKNKKEDFKNNPIAQMNRIHYLLNYYKDRALLNPTVENIKNYLVMQNMIMQQSTLFSQNWQKTMLLYPEFNYGISHPTDSAISELSQSNLHDNEIKVVKSMTQHMGLLFFYNGNNPLSSEMMKTVSTFSHQYGFSSIAVSVDGKVIQSDMPFKINHGQAESLGIKALPALVLVDPKTHWHNVISYGYASSDDLLSDCYNVYTSN